MQAYKAHLGKPDVPRRMDDGLVWAGHVAAHHQKRLALQAVASMLLMGSILTSDATQHHVLQCLVNVGLSMWEGWWIGVSIMETPYLPAIRALRPAWKKGRIIGQKRPLKPKHVWAIRVRLELAENHRDLALFNLAIDSKSECLCQVMEVSTRGLCAFHSRPDSRRQLWQATDNRRVERYRIGYRPRGFGCL